MDSDPRGGDPTSGKCVRYLSAGQAEGQGSTPPESRAGKKSAGWETGRAEGAVAQLVESETMAYLDFCWTK